ncbi:hypothetical protein [Nocardioides sp. L-11A]|uniref:hypothetical protein n=1 Tax=Nocardioides sp. L-11A TaxID=3043848 RepID=UPI00249A3C7C|nr:hypothetical protein QJ852_09970 [Nocardioides sp. L-11A]
MKRAWFRARRAAAQTITAPTAPLSPAVEVQVAEDGCHPVWHELGVHAPVGNARSVTP